MSFKRTTTKADVVVSFSTTHPPPLLRFTPCPDGIASGLRLDPANLGADAAVSGLTDNW